MRLVCPNCEAKYEVPEDAIPETGRDVQCANCGHAWYQMRPRAQGAEVQPSAPAPVEAKVAPVAEPESTVMASPEPAPAEKAPAVEAAPETVAEAVTEVGEAIAEAATEVVAEAEATVAEAAETATAEIQAAVAPIAEAISTAVAVEAAVDQAVAQAQDPVDAAPVAADPSVPAEPETETVAEAQAPTDESAEDASDGEGDAGRPVPEAAMPAAAYAVDESVLAILREEAERESQVRRAEAKPLEIQPDLGVEAAVPPKHAQAAVLPSGPAADDMDASAKPSARRDLLPDVEEINSTLRPSDESGDADATAMANDAPVEARSSFRSGFLLVMTIAILGAALYIAAPMLRDAVPALAGYLDAYVDFVDGLRLQLDGLMRSATAAIGGEAG